MKLTDYKDLKFTGIYLIRNIITKNCYVGQAKNIASRIQQHLGSAFSIPKKDYNTPLHAAFRKHGIDNFELEVLQKCEYSELNNLEQYWVSVYDCFKNGYNQTAGGKQSIRHIKLTAENATEIRTLLAEARLTYDQIAEKFNICKDLVYRINVGKAWHDNNCDYPIRHMLLSEKYQFRGICVAKRSISSDKILMRFPNTSFAAISTGKYTNSPHIVECCNGKRGSAYGFNWTWEEISLEDWEKLFESPQN